MSRTVDKERTEMSIEFRVERSKRIRRQMDDAVRLWLEGLGATHMARRLGVSKHRVYWLLRALQLIDSVAPGRPGVKRSPRPGFLYGLRVPPIDGTISRTRTEDLKQSNERNVA